MSHTRSRITQSDPSIWEALPSPQHLRKPLGMHPVILLTKRMGVITALLLLPRLANTLGRRFCPSPPCSTGCMLIKRQGGAHPPPPPAVAPPTPPPSAVESYKSRGLAPAAAATEEEETRRRGGLRRREKEHRRKTTRRGS